MRFAHGKGDTQFMNMALNFNPIMALTVPYSTLGTGLIVLPTKDPKQAIVTFFLFSSTGKASTSRRSIGTTAVLGIRLQLVF